MTASKKDISKVIHIRPYQVLSIPDGFSEEIRFFMPQAQGQGSVSTIESIMLLKLMRIVNPDFLFEFGTYKGLTTRLLLENIPDSNIKSERIYTLDLPDLQNVHFQGADADVAAEAIGFPRKYLESQRKHLVKQLLQDSMTFQGSDYSKKFSFIFVDANHEVSYVKKDTENALAMMSEGPSCVVWHDYGNPQFPELTEYIDGLSGSIPIHHIEDTMLAFHLLGKNVGPRKV